jgi:amidase
VVEHVLTRSVRDSAAMLDAVCGPDVGAPFNIAPPERPFSEEVRREPGRLRIAFNTRSPLGTPVHPEYVKAVLETAILLHRLGHDVEEAEPDIDGMALARSFFELYYGEVAADLEDLEVVLGRKATAQDVETITWALGLLGRAASAGSFAHAKRLWGRAARVAGRFFEAYDIYVTPTVAQPPARIGELAPTPIEIVGLKMVNALGLGRLLRKSGITDRLAVQNMARTPFTQLANITGLPAMSVPLHWARDGLPAGVQFMARTANEAVLFRLAAQLEAERPWFHKRPAAS